MKDLLSGIGIAIVILALVIGHKGCMELNKPLFGVNGSIIATQEKEK